jgi:spore coat polysaccharide biosynthesis protein SpsF (cytidylyltransferase family)|tara:strand:+ start:534 stop:1643 length:1110 start_codon:yes stop_codon:yes gene_type:complete
MKIGRFRIIDIILSKLHENKNITQIYIATGDKNKNQIFEKKINRKKYKKINYYYHTNDKKVTNRVKKVCDKIKNEYSLIVSGDCPLIDNNYINRLYYKFKNSHKNTDFILPNRKVLHEGIFLFRTKSWKLIDRLSNTKYFQEHPASVINYKKKQFQKCFLKINLLEKKKNLRMSVDTYSDLRYLNIILKFTKKKILNFRDLIKYEILNILNSHVAQRKIFENYDKKINILTTANEGSIFRKYSKIIEREIKETTSTNINIIFIENKKKFKNLYIKKNTINIICLPNHSNEKIKKIIKSRKTILVEKHHLKSKEYIKISSEAVKNKTIFIKDRKILENTLLKTRNKSVIYLKNLIKKKFSKNGCVGITKL